MIELDGGVDANVVGGKAAGIALAASLGLRVPPSIVLPVPHTEDDLRKWPQRAATKVRDWAAERGIGHLVLRSSAAVEDQARHSYAGIFHSAFAPVALDAIEAALSSVLSGFSSPEREAYEEAAGISPSDTALAILVQATVFPCSSGIMFAWGSSGARQTRVQAAWGLGLNLVQGITGGDSYEYDEADGAERITTGDKPLALYPHPSGSAARPGDYSLVRFGGQDAAAKVVFLDEDAGLAYVRVPEDHSRAACLTPELLRQLSRVASLSAPGFDRGLDVEWVEDVNGRVWVVQLRPMTAAPLATRPAEPGTAAQPADHVLVGEPGAPGTRSGLVSTPDSILRHDQKDGRVLVCGPAKPELMPAIARAGAIVSSDGGLLCHVAIVARELGKPCVIGVSRAEHELGEGQAVRVEGTAGRVVREGIAAPPATETRDRPEDDHSLAFLTRVAAVHALSGPDASCAVLPVTSTVEREILARGDLEDLLLRPAATALMVPVERWSARWAQEPSLRHQLDLGLWHERREGGWHVLFSPQCEPAHVTQLMESIKQGGHEHARSIA